MQYLRKFPDIERRLAKIYQYSIKQSVKAVYFEDISSNKLKEFREILKHLVDAEKLIIQF